MARSTCNPDVELPKGMLRFEVIRTGIKDSLGQYCLPGDMAVLDKRLAKHYLELNFIRVALPEFEDADDDDTGGDEPDENERTEVADNSRSRSRKGRTGSSSDDE